MRHRHLESVSSRSLSVRGSWGTAPSVFWYGAPGGTQGPLGKGGAAERWRVVYPIGIATRHGAKPATTHTSKRNAPAASRVGFASGKINAPPLGDHKFGPKIFLPTHLHRKHPPAASRTGFASGKINAPPLGDCNLDLKSLLRAFHCGKEALI